jgi:hypothetical protein
LCLIPASVNRILENWLGECVAAPPLRFTQLMDTCHNL